MEEEEVEEIKIEEQQESKEEPEIYEKRFFTIEPKKLDPMDLENRRSKKLKKKRPNDDRVYKLNPNSGSEGITRDRFTSHDNTKIENI